MIDVEIPKAFRPLFEPHRYKVAEGGRGSAKSWSFATALLIKGAQKPMRFLCAREIQKSIKDSVHQLLKDRIQALGLEQFYEVTNNEIRGINGTQFGFEGLRHNITNIKSWEGADVAWVEEAQVVSKSSWQILIPTIRKEGSEIWVTYNPELEEDETHQRFVIHPPPDCWHVHVTYRDNPWLSDVLRKEMEHLRLNDPTAYEHIWEGKCREAVEGAIFGEEMRKAQEEGRIRDVPYEKTKPVDAFFDLGRADKTAIWLAQMVGYERRVLWYYEDNRKHFSHYVKVMKELPYAYGTIYLPHDASHEQLAAQKSIQTQAKEAFSTVKVLPRIPHKAQSIDAARGIFDSCVFDREKCSDGLTCLRRYAYKVDPETGRTSREPDHDTPWSHGADAFQAMGMALEEVKQKKITRPYRDPDDWRTMAGM